jgi:hypothetical protein
VKIGGVRNELGGLINDDGAVLRAGRNLYALNR